MLPPPHPRHPNRHRRATSPGGGRRRRRAAGRRAAPVALVVIVVLIVLRLPRLLLLLLPRHQPPHPRRLGCLRTRLRLHHPRAQPRGLRLRHLHRVFEPLCLVAQRCRLGLESVRLGLQLSPHRLRQRQHLFPLIARGRLLALPRAHLIQLRRRRRAPLCRRCLGLPNRLLALRRACHFRLGPLAPLIARRLGRLALQCRLRELPTQRALRRHRRRRLLLHHTCRDPLLPCRAHCLRLRLCLCTRGLCCVRRRLRYHQRLDRCRRLGHRLPPRRLRLTSILPRIRYRCRRLFRLPRLPRRRRSHLLLRLLPRLLQLLCCPLLRLSPRPSHLSRQPRLCVGLRLCQCLCRQRGVVCQLRRGSTTTHKGWSEMARAAHPHHFLWLTGRQHRRSGRRRPCLRGCPRPRGCGGCGKALRVCTRLGPSRLGLL